MCRIRFCLRLVVSAKIVKALIEQTKPVPARAVKYYEMMQTLKAEGNAEDYGRYLKAYTDCALLFIRLVRKLKKNLPILSEHDIFGKIGKIL